MRISLWFKAANCPSFRELPCLCDFFSLMSPLPLHHPSPEDHNFLANKCLLNVVVHLFIQVLALSSFWKSRNYTIHAFSEYIFFICTWPISIWQIARPTRTTTSIVVPIRWHAMNTKGHAGFLIVIAACVGESAVARTTSNIYWLQKFSWALIHVKIDCEQFSIYQRTGPMAILWRKINNTLDQQCGFPHCDWEQCFIFTLQANHLREIGCRDSEKVKGDQNSLCRFERKTNFS